MDFREMLAADLREVFLNPGEFAEAVELAGHEGILCLCEPLTLESSEGNDRPLVSYEGLTLYLAAADLPEDPLPDRKISFQHEDWHVLRAERDGGLLTLQLYRERV